MTQASPAQPSCLTPADPRHERPWRQKLARLLAPRVANDPPLAAVWGLNEPNATRWAQPVQGFEHTLHLYPAEWAGMAAAAAYAPGHKLAFRATQPLSDRQHLQLANRVAGACDTLSIRTAVFHSHSAVSEVLARSLRAAGVRCLGVWHGSSAQFHSESELAAFNGFARLRRQGVFTKVAAVKPGMHLADELIEREPLLNFPPALARPRRPAGLRGTALVPVPINWVKNFHTNVLAALAEPRLQSVIVTARPSGDFAAQFAGRVHEHRTPTREALFSLLETVDVVLNASLSECQPMVALEALAHRVPCIVPPLGLAGLDAHPYSTLTRAVATDTLTELRAVIGRVVDVAQHDAEELAAMLDDFVQQWQTQARTRFADFVAS